MKRILFTVLALVAYCTAANAQSIIDVDDQRNPNDFYQKGIVGEKKAMPYPSVRENDVIWECVVWREIDFNEKFNQFFYHPQETESNTQDRINLINLIMRNVRNGKIPVYEDDDMKVEWEIDKAILHLTGNPKATQKPKIVDGEAEIDEETGEIVMIDVMEPGSFDSTDVSKIILKEKWYIDKQDTRQKVRIVGLAFWFMKDQLVGDGKTKTESFWIPMDDMRVRQVFVNANAYDENNDVVERSYDDIFIQRYFDSYIVRESNVYNRKISDYLTDIDAVLESQRIEDKIFEIESDMWEY